MYIGKALDVQSVHYYQPDWKKGNKKITDWF
jgi:hypothetical protein